MSLDFQQGGGASQVSEEVTKEGKEISQATTGTNRKRLCSHFPKKDILTNTGLTTGLTARK